VTETFDAAAIMECSDLSRTGVSGLDVYAKDGGAWRFVGGARPTQSPTNDAEVITGMAAVSREFLVYLPLYNGVSQLEIGVPEEAAFRFEPRASSRPLVVYGTSITQGCCASRPGMVYTAILGRRLGVPVINLGFSGNGKAEPEMARLLTELDPAVYVLDSLPNMTPEQVVERMPALIETIRAARPHTPIVLVEHLLYPNSRFRPQKAADIASSNASLRRIHDARRKAGDRFITVVSSATLLGTDGDGTVDDCLGEVTTAQSLADLARIIVRRGPHDRGESGVIDDGGGAADEDPRFGRGAGRLLVLSQVVRDQDSGARLRR